MMPPHILIRHISPSTALVSGYDSRSIVMEVVGRPPAWCPGAERGWVVQPFRVADIVAAAERRGRDVELIGPRSATPTSSPGDKVQPGYDDSWSRPDEFEDSGLW